MMYKDAEVVGKENVYDAITDFGIKNHINVEGLLKAINDLPSTRMDIPDYRPTETLKTGASIHSTMVDKVDNEYIEREILKRTEKELYSLLTAEISKFAEISFKKNPQMMCYDFKAEIDIAPRFGSIINGGEDIEGWTNIREWDRRKR